MIFLYYKMNYVNMEDLHKSVLQYFIKTNALQNFMWRKDSFKVQDRPCFNGTEYRMSMDIVPHSTL